MTTVTIPKIEYRALKSRADAFERLVSDQRKLARLAPPIRSRRKIISAMKATGLYNAKFLRSLDQGLKNSRMFTD